MQIKIDKADLQEALTLTRGVSFSENPVNVVYESIMFEVALGGVRVSATDGAIWSHVTIPGKSGSVGRALVRSKEFVSLITDLDDGEVEIGFSGKLAKLTSGKFRAEFGMADAMEFPAPLRLRDRPLAWAPADRFAELIKATVGSADTRIDRPYLNGVRLTCDGPRLEAVAADGARIAVGALRTGVTDFSASFTVGTRLAAQAASLAVLRPVDNLVGFGVHEEFGIFQGDKALIYGVLPPQGFPDWRNAPGMPKPGDSRILAEFDRKALIKVARRVVAIGAKLKGAVPVDIELRADGLLALSVKASGRSAEEVIQGAVVTHGDHRSYGRRIGGDLFLQALNAITSARVMLTIPRDQKLPVGLISCEDAEKNEIGAIHWLMPRS